LAVLAKTTNKPFYVVAESFKFVRLYPLNQQDLPNDEKVTVDIGNVFGKKDNSQYIFIFPIFPREWCAEFLELSY